MARRPRHIDTSTAPGHPAYKLGLTGQSYAAYKRGAVPLALAERSPGGIARAARQMTNAAYRPAYAQLNTQEQRLRDLQTKRDADNAAFAQWVTSRGDQLRADAAARTIATQQRLAEGQQQFATQLQQIKDSANANAQRLGGNVIGGADANQLAATQAAGQASTLAATNAAQSHIAQGQSSLEATLANNPAVVAAARAKDFADILDKITQVADSRQKVALQQGADTARNIQNLLGQEVTKAQSIIAANQLAGKQQFTAEQNALNRKTSIKKTRITSGTSRANTKDRIALAKSTPNKYGVLPDQWAKWSASHRQRVMQNFNAKSGKGSNNAQQKATAKANTQVNNALALINGEAPPPTPKQGGTPLGPPPAVKPGHIKPLLDWLQAAGASPIVARVAVLKKLYPHLKITKKTAPKTFDLWNTYVKSLTGSR